MFFNIRPDRRRRTRQLLNTSVQVFTGAAPLDALGINVTDVGMCLFTMANLPLASHLEVEFVPPEGLYVVRFPGIVRHRAVYLYGIEFLDPLAGTGNAPRIHSAPSLDGRKSANPRQNR